MPKTTVRDPPRANGWTLAYCSPGSEWGPGGNTGEIKAVRKGTGHPTSKSRWLRTSVLSNRHSPTYGSYMGPYLYLYLEISVNKEIITHDSKSFSRLNGTNANLHCSKQRHFLDSNVSINEHHH